MLLWLALPADIDTATDLYDPHALIFFQAVRNLRLYNTVYMANATKLILTDVFAERLVVANAVHLYQREIKTGIRKRRYG